jgi:hypothetical protein
MQLISRVVVLGQVLVLLAAFYAGAEQVCTETILPTSAADTFSVAEDGTVFSNDTGLMWMRCSLGQNWEGKTCGGEPVFLSWPAALKATVGFQFAGYSNWRLPNKNELESIVETSCSSPAINISIFPKTPLTFFWSASPYAGISSAAWSVDFAYGTVNASVKSGLNSVRLVRDLD